MQQRPRSKTLQGMSLAVWVVWFSGCASLPRSSSTMALTYTPGRTTAYRMVSENTRSVEWRGLTTQTMDQVRGGTSGRMLDLSVTETVGQVDPNGRAILNITIDRLSYRGFAGGEVSLDYDSQRTDNEPSALASLVGAGYRIEVDRSGRTLRVVSPCPALTSVESQTPHLQTARGLVSERAILNRHSLEALAGDTRPAKPGQTWTVSREVAFGSMGTKTFNKTYTVKEVKTVNDTPTALVEMTAVSESDSAGNPMGELFASQEDFTGELTFDLAAGQIDVWHETMEVTWTFIDPTTADREQTQQRSALMKARQALLVQRLDSSGSGH